MVSRIIYLPEHPSLPIHFQRRATHIVRLADMAGVRNLAIIEKRPAIGDKDGLAGRIWHIPGVNDVSLHIDEIDGLVGISVWSKQREPRECARLIVAVQAHAAAFDRERFNSCRCRRARRRLGDCIAGQLDGASAPQFKEYHTSNSKAVTCFMLRREPQCCVAPTKWTAL